MLKRQDSGCSVLAKLEDCLLSADSSEDMNVQTRAMVKECLDKINELTMKSVQNEQSTNTRLEVVEKAAVELGTEVKEKKIIISGLREEKSENTRQVALKALKKALSTAKTVQEKEDYEGAVFPADPNQLSLSSLDKAYRVGTRHSTWSPRNIMVSLKDSYHRYILLKTKPFLDKSVNFYLEEDMTSMSHTHKAKLRRIVSVAKELKMDAKIVGNRVFIDDKAHGVNDLDTIRSSIAIRMKEEKVLEEGIAYKGQDSIFSNFYMANFEIDGMIYNCVEQYYQHSKAVACNYHDRARKIMNCTDPRRIKELGDGVQSDDEWLATRVPTLYDGALTKFQQNHDLAITLVSTGNVNLLEATTDMFFGCGIGLQSKRWEKKDWSGENVAGRIIMRIRSELSGSTLPMSTADILTQYNEVSPDASKNDSHSLSLSSQGNDSNISATQKSESSLPMERNQHGKSNQKKPTNHRSRGRGRGRGRSSYVCGNTSNVTDRSSRRQNTYKQQISKKDQEFLNLSLPPKDHNKSEMPMEITTSTPKCSYTSGPKHLSDSELTAMGIDPNSDYASDVRHKYSTTIE